MFANTEDIRKRILTIEEELRRFDVVDKKWPEGKLICAKNDKNYKWYVSKNNECIYLPKSERQMAQMLAQKKYFELRKKELLSELRACRYYMNKADSEGQKVDNMLANPEYEKLLDGKIELLDKELQLWANSEYEKNSSHPENLNVKATQGKMVRSKSEAIIDKILFTSGVPFRYENKLVLGNSIVYPDFTVRHPKTGKYYYWEHLGMMDDPEYANSACNKIKIYCEYDIVPSINLILTFETKKNPLGIDSVERIVRDYFG